jgi:hypothetical protein
VALARELWSPGPATRIGNRIRGLLTGIHPALEHAIGPKVSHPAVLEILSRCGGPAGIAKAGRRKLTAIAEVHAPRMGERLVESIMTALGAAYAGIAPVTRSSGADLSGPPPLRLAAS